MAQQISPLIKELPKKIQRKDIFDYENCSEFNVYMIEYSLPEGTEVTNLSAERFVYNLLDPAQNKNTVGAIEFLLTLLPPHDQNFREMVANHSILKILKKAAERREKTQTNINQFKLNSHIPESKMSLNKEGLKVSDIMDLGIETAPALLTLSQDVLNVTETGFGEVKEEMRNIVAALREPDKKPSLMGLFYQQPEQFNESLISRINASTEHIQDNMELMKKSLKMYEDHGIYITETYLPDQDKLIETLKGQIREETTVLEDGTKAEKPKSREEQFRDEVIRQKIYGLQARNVTAETLLANEQIMSYQLMNSYFQSDITVNVLIPRLLMEIARMNTSRSISEILEMKDAIIGTIEGFASENREKTIESAKRLQQFGYSEDLVGRISQVAIDSDALDTAPTPIKKIGSLFSRL